MCAAFSIKKIGDIEKMWNCEIKVDEKIKSEMV